MKVTFSSGTLSTKFQFILLVSVIGLFAAGGWFTYNAVHAANENSSKIFKNYAEPSVQATVTNFQQCSTAAGSIIQQSYPETCVTKSGQHFVDK